MEYMTFFYLPTLKEINNIELYNRIFKYYGSKILFKTKSKYILYLKFLTSLSTLVIVNVIGLTTILVFSDIMKITKHFQNMKYGKFFFGEFFIDFFK